MKNKWTFMRCFLTLSLISGLSWVSTAGAQDNAVKSAADASGERVGTEQSGLYSETQVRGFDLNESGAYPRLQGRWWTRAWSAHPAYNHGCQLIRTPYRAAQLRLYAGREPEVVL